MKIDNKYTLMYLHDIVIAQLSDEYKAKGYKVYKEHKIGRYRADFVAQKNGETLVFEVLTGPLTQKRKDALKALTTYIKSKANHKFKFVYAAPPQDKIIDIENIEEIIRYEMYDNPIPAELDELSTHTRIDEVSDIDIYEIKIDKDGTISLDGTGIVSVILQYGSDSDVDSDMGDISYYSFPFTFSAKLEYDSGTLGLKDKDSDNLEINIDTSKYYE
ncbi:MAG: hypothetical protein HQK99_01585 [Nitrospirae bacterium]|nr:hypothetical protein [Nitrospirota bacterium]